LWLLVVVVVVVAVVVVLLLLVVAGGGGGGRGNMLACPPHAKIVSAKTCGGAEISLIQNNPNTLALLAGQIVCCWRLSYFNVSVQGGGRDREQDREQERERETCYC
jgi:hypothetical protein